MDEDQFAKALVGKVNPQNMVSLISSVQREAIVKLLISKGLVTREEYAKIFKDELKKTADEIKL